MAMSFPKEQKLLNINDLHDDLLVEILHRLQCVSAVRCKSVLKRWYALISTPHFIRRLICHHRRLSQIQHRQQHRHHECSILFFHQDLIFIPDSPKLEAEPIVKKFLSRFLENYRVWGESNGWLLCTNRCYHSNTYYICNPLTNHWLQLPPAPSSFLWPSELSVGFICDPYYHVDEETNAVKLNSHCRFAVIRIPKVTELKHELKVEVFSSSTGRWSEIFLSCSKGFRVTGLGKAIAFNGKLHFMGRGIILTFDPFKNIGSGIIRQCQFINVPKGMYPNSVMVLIVTSSGSLGIIEFPHEHNYVYYDYDCAYNDVVYIWELRDYEKETWYLQEKTNVKKIMQLGRAANPNLYPSLSYVAVALHLYNPKIVCCIRDDNIASLDWQMETTSRLRRGQLTWYTWLYVFPMVLPLWPVPALSFSENNENYGYDGSRED